MDFLPVPPWAQEVVGFLSTLAMLIGAAVAAVWGLASKLVTSLYDEKFETRLKDHQLELDTDLESHKAKLAKESAKELESLKAELAKESAKELESLKADLRVDAFRKEDRLRHFHQKQAEVLAETFSGLSQTATAMTRVVKLFEAPGELSKEEYSKCFVAEFKGFKEQYGRDRIYLSEALCLRIDEIHKVMHRAYNTMQVTSNFSESMKLSLWGETVELWEQKGGSLLAEIEKECRRIVGNLEDPACQ